MDQEELPVELYDFLYRDSNRLASYYAQLFRGRLSLVEETDSEKHSSEKQLKGNVQVVSGNIKAGDESQASVKRVFDPHDVVTTDVLSFLVDNNYVHHNIEECPNGGLVLVKGTLFFADNSIFASVVNSLNTFSGNDLEVISQLTGEAADQNIVFDMVAYYNISKDTAFPPVFYLETEDGLIAGMIKSEGMEEPVTSFIYKHGTAGLPDVYLLGLKEESTYLRAADDMPPVATKIWELGEKFEMLIFPNDNVRLTPLAIFRKFEPVS